MSAKDLVKKKLEELLKILGVEAEISLEEKDRVLYVKLTKTEIPLLIGFKGETLKALQHILRLLVLKELGEESPTIILDIEDYRKREEEKLKEYIKRVALIVKETNRAEALKPMSSYKRRLVHLAVSEIPGVESESFGEEPERRIIIKPKSDNSP